MRPSARGRLQLTGQRRRDAPDDADLALAVLELDRAALADAGQQLARGVRQADVDVDPHRREQGGDLGAQRVDPVAGQRRDEDAPGDGRRRGLGVAGGRVEQVRLVERQQARLVAGARARRGRSGRSTRCSSKCASEASTTSTRTSARLTSSSVARKASTSWCGSLWMNPTVSVTIAVWPSPSLTWRLVGSSVANSLSSALRHLGADERVEQRRLAGVRVADDADGRPQPAVAAARRRLALLADLLDALLHLRDPGPDDPPVGLELALAGSPRADPALGPRQVGPQLGQPRQLVLELGELDLEAALVGLRMEREDVEDQPAAVDDLDVEQALERALLGGRQLVVGDRAGRSRSRAWRRPAPRPCPCRRTSSGRRGGGSATRRRRPRHRPSWPGWRARRASPRRSSRPRRRCRRRRGRRSRRAVRGRSDCVRSWPGKDSPGHRRLRVAASASGSGSASVASSQVMSGSERNHVRWRLANARFRWASSSIAASRVSSPSRTAQASR